MVLLLKKKKNNNNPKLIFVLFSEISENTDGRNKKRQKDFH